MKKLSVILCVVMLAALMLPLTVGAVGAPYQGDQTFNLQNKTPTIDGKIDASEGWSNKGIFDETHTGRFLAELPLTSIGEFYFAYDNDGLYFAYSMKELGGAYTVRFYEPKWSDAEGRELDENVGGMNYPDVNAGSYSETNYPDKTADGIVIEGALMPPSFEEIAKKDPTAEHITCAYWTSNTGNNNVYSTEADGSDYGWDGDVFALSFDPCGMFRPLCNENENYDKAPQFNVGIFEGNTVKVRSRFTDKEIENAKGAGTLTTDGITFEVMIPWDAIVEECNKAAADQGIAVNHTFTKEDLLADGAKHRAAITHMDRFDDPEAGYVDDWGRCITVCNYCDYATVDFPDGVPGVASSGDGIKSMGLTLVMPGTPAGGDTQAQGEETEVVTNANGSVVTDASGKPVTQKKPSSTKAAGTNGKGNGSGSAQTFDAGIAVALGAVATSAIGFYYSKKKH